jgi:hypothetical protein
VETFCPCKLYIYKDLYTFSAIRLKQNNNWTGKVNRLQVFTPNNEYSYNNTHFIVNYEGQHYALGFKRVVARATNRNYDHLSRYGGQYSRSFSIRPGKYALGNDPNQIRDFS